MTKKINLSLGAGAFVLVNLGSVLFANADAITRQLQFGMTGTDIGVMQTFFAKDPTIYPQGLVTNYFGIMTKGAVMNFQARNGIATVGRVGPATLPVLNAAIANGGLGGTVSNPGVRPITMGTVTNNGGGMTTITWSTSNPARGTIYYSTSPLTMYEGDNSVSISGSGASAGNFNTSQSLQLTGLQAGSTYYYTIYTTDQNGNVNMTWPSTFTAN